MATPSDGTAGKTTLNFAWNLPNILTIARMVLVPVLAVVLLLNPHDQAWRFAATAVFAIAIATDFADGRIARKYNLVTNFGKIWDSIADKALTGMAFIGLSVIGELPWWFTAVVLVREWGITLMRFRVLKYGVMAAKQGGKLKTFLQGIALTLFLLWLPEAGAWFDIGRWVIMGAAFVLTVVTGIDYVIDAIKLRRESLRVGHPVDYSGMHSHAHDES